jgi:hypothetical protein
VRIRGRPGLLQRLRNIHSTTTGATPVLSVLTLMPRCWNAWKQMARRTRSSRMLPASDWISPLSWMTLIGLPGASSAQERVVFEIWWLCTRCWQRCSQADRWAKISYCPCPPPWDGNVLDEALRYECGFIQLRAIMKPRATAPLLLDHAGP